MRRVVNTFILLPSALLLASILFGSSAAAAGECADGMARAGQPRRVAPWAKPSSTCHYEGYYVGGGAPCLGEPRYANEGTWGWDYVGHLLKRRVELGWWHGRCYQGGTGAYKTDR